MPTHRKKPVADSCYDMAIKRLEHVYERFDQIALSFSGGKDSTVCLHLCIEAARRCGRLPLEVISFDEEAIPTQTVEYMARVAQWPEVNFHWYCVPIEHRNACSATSTLWYPWAPEDEAKWCRPLPPLAITDFPGFTRAGIGEQTTKLYPPSKGTFCSIMGIRTQESMSRYHAVAVKRGFHAFMTDTPECTKAYPIYDWATEDVWLAPARFGWDYNRAYDVMDALNIPRHDQRCAPPYGEQPIRGLWKFKQCWPELWAKMVDRVPGAATAARYANTELYGFGVEDDVLPAGMTWQRWTMGTLDNLPPASRQESAAAINVCIDNHHNYTTDPVPDEAPHPKSGFSWKILYTAAKVGGNKFDRTQQKMWTKAKIERERRERREMKA